jgi:uncharacterized protein (DUF1015 family)
MAEFIPFRAWRPRPDNVQRVVSRPYESYTRDEAEHILRTEPQSFLHVVRPDFSSDAKLPSGSTALFRASKAMFSTLTAQGAMVCEAAPAYYIYAQQMAGRVHMGIMGCASVRDYDSGHIRIHEQTIADRERKLKEYLSVCDINAEPVCLTCPRHPDLARFIADSALQAPLFDFATDDGRQHRLWAVTLPHRVQLLRTMLASVPALYIADGHHRSASSVLLAHEQWAKGRTDPDAPHNYFLSILFPDDQLRIWEFNRVVRDLGTHTPATFLAALSARFHLSPGQATSAKGTFGMYLSGTWHTLRLRQPESTGTVGSLDVSILAHHILAPILGITDQRTDRRLGFVPGPAGTAALQQMVDSGQQAVAFALHPVSGQEFYAISDQGLTMPPKSTYIVPKLLSGLVVYGLGE